MRVLNYNQYAPHMLKLTNISFSDNEHLGIIGNTLIIYSDCEPMDNILIQITDDKKTVEEMLILHMADPQIFTIEVIIKRIDSITKGKFSRAYKKLLDIHGMIVDMRC